MYLRDRNNRLYVTARPDYKLMRRQIRSFNVGEEYYKFDRLTLIAVSIVIPWVIGVALMIIIGPSSALIVCSLAAIATIFTLRATNTIRPSVRYANKSIDRLIQNHAIVDYTHLYGVLDSWAWRLVNQSYWRYAADRWEKMEPFYSDLDLNLIAVNTQDASPEVSNKAREYLAQRFDEFVADLKARDQLIADLGRPLRKVLEAEANRVAQSATDQQQARQDETDQLIRQLIDGVSPKSP